MASKNHDLEKQEPKTQKGTVKMGWKFSKHVQRVKLKRGVSLNKVAKGRYSDTESVDKSSNHYRTVHAVHISLKSYFSC